MAGNKKQQAQVDMPLSIKRAKNNDEHHIDNHISGWLNGVAVSMDADNYFASVCPLLNQSRCQSATYFKKGGASWGPSIIMFSWSFQKNNNKFK